MTTGKQAELVDVTKAITGIKLDLRYAGTNNCFGMSIVDVKKAYLDRVAAGALGRVQKDLPLIMVMALLFVGSLQTVVCIQACL